MSNQGATITTKGPGLFLRFIYFIFVGWWLGLIWIVLAEFFNLIIIGLPLGLAMINRIPQIMTMKPRRVQTRVEVKDGQTVVKETKIKQRSFLLRALYFIFIGSWLSILWMLLAWLIATVTLGFGLPISMWMFDRTPGITTLARI